MPKPDRTAPKKPSIDGVPPESLDQVRDILFGGQMRTVETRLQGMEERLGREQESMRAEFTKRVAELDAFAKRETQALHDRVATESDARNAALKALAADIREAQKAMDKRHAQLEQSTALSDAELREALIAQSRADRATLGALLTDIAAKLADGPAKAGKGGKG